MVFESSILYSLVIYTLDESVWYYMTPLYLTFVLWFSIVLVGLVKKIFMQGKSDGVVIGLSVVCVVGILSVSTVVCFWENYLEESHMRTKLQSIAEEYQRYDCIFIEENEDDNLLQGFWFEFGNYDEFKKISVQDFEQKGIGAEELAGRKDDSGLIIYAPMECLKGQEYQMLADNSIYGAYKMMDGAGQ